MPMDLDPVEIRVLGCLLEKQRTTPDAYPLTLNSLRLACNQATNRDPVVDYDEGAVRDAAQRLGRRGYARFTSGQGSRTAKYRHMLDEALGLARDELALLCVLMLRGAQTPGELKARSERLSPFADLAAVDQTLERLIERELVARLARRPGQKEERFAQLLGGDGEETEPGPAPVAVAAASAAPAKRSASGGAPSPAAGVEARIGRLEEDVRELRSALAELRRELGA